MPALTVASTYGSGIAPTETQLDSTRDSLLTFFNTTKLNESNVKAAGMLLSTVTDAGDNAEMKWGTTSEGRIKFTSATPSFDIKNTASAGDIRFTTKLTTTEAEALRLEASDGSIRIGTGGVLRAGTGQGYTAWDTLWLLARYRKPRLEYSSASIVTIEENSDTSGETIVVARDRVWKIVDRTCSLATSANGYASGNTGAAVSGIEDGLTESANTWYYIYAVEVQYGTNADGINAIMVATTVSPLQANNTTNNTEFGSGKWLYLGCIRNGMNSGTGDSDIVPFVYDEWGHIDFTQGPHGSGAGIRILNDATDTDSSYTVSIGTGNANIPHTASQVRFQMYRASDGFSMQYETSGGTDLFISGSKTDSPNPGYADMIVPVVSGNVLKLIRNDAGAQTKRFYIAGITDHYA